MVANSETKVKLQPRLSWLEFESLFLAIKKDYDLYGEIVLEKRLGESIDVYKNVFTSEAITREDFIKKLRPIWQEKHHLVATNFSQLISFYEMALEQNIHWRHLLPETDKYRNKYENKGNDRIFAISKELYDYIVQKAEMVWYNAIHIEKNGCIYQLFLEEKGDGTTYREIRMEKINIIKVD